MIKFIRSLNERSRKYLSKLLHPSLWPAFKIQTHLTYDEVITLNSLAKGRFTVLEIGSYLGASAYCFGDALRRNTEPSKLICIDTWNNDSMSEGGRDTFSEFEENTSNFRTLITPLRGFSFDLVEDVSKLVEHVDLLFIDGDHSYSGVKSDWDNYKFLLRSGSVVAFHDWGWAAGVQKVVKEDVISMVSEHSNLANLWWGKIK